MTHLLLFFIILGQLFLNCVTTPLPSDAQENLSSEESKRLAEYQAEIEIGRNMAGRLLAFYGVFDDKKLSSYLNRVARYVASNGDFPDRRYMVGILATESVNAFACPGGYILITAGALKIAENESELAAILGHEVAHVGHQHMFKTLQKMNEKELEETAKETDAMKNLPPPLAVRKRTDGETSELGSKMARYLAGSAGAGLSILQAAKAGMSLIINKGIDKALELQADQEGVRYAILSGYEPTALMQYLARLDAKKATINAKILEKTHPKITDRSESIKILLASLATDLQPGAVGEKRFQKYKHILTNTNNEHKDSLEEE